MSVKLSRESLLFSRKIIAESMAKDFSPTVVSSTMSERNNEENIKILEYQVELLEKDIKHLNTKRMFLAVSQEVGHLGSTRTRTIAVYEGMMEKLVNQVQVLKERIKHLSSKRNHGLSYHPKGAAPHFFIQFTLADDVMLIRGDLKVVRRKDNTGNPISEYLECFMCGKGLGG